jgi:3-oxoacyl-[acyl-carrier-protein] synthase-3
MNHVRIVSSGIYLPEKVLTNFDLEKIVDTTNEWILERTGIHERRIVAEGEATSDLASRAAAAALETAGVAAEDVDLIVLATITPDSLFPATACHVQRNLGAVRAGALDVSAACTGFIYALSVGANAVRCGAARNVLVIGAEAMSRVVNWEDRGTCVLFGDGAGAVLLQPSDEPSLLFEDLGCDGNLSDLIRMRGGGSRFPASPETVKNGYHFIEVRGREVFKQAVKVMEICAREAAERLNVDLKDIGLIIPHQANMRILEAAAERLGLPPERVYSNLDRYGNTSGATSPIALHEALAEGKIQEGDIVLLISFGAGFTYGTSAIRWVGNGAVNSGE